MNNTESSSEGAATIFLNSSGDDGFSANTDSFTLGEFAADINTVTLGQ